MVDSGLLNKWIRKWVRPPNECDGLERSASHQTVSVVECQGGFLLLILGLVISSAVLGMEIWTNNLRGTQLFKHLFGGKKHEQKRDPNELMTPVIVEVPQLQRRHSEKRQFRSIHDFSSEDLSGLESNGRRRWSNW